MKNQEREVEIQRQYYSNTAAIYDELHVKEKDNHYMALCVMLGLIDFLDIKSILEIGAGTGRAISFVKRERPDMLIRGIEPVDQLREVAYDKGISREELIAGDALELQYDNNEFDLVCEFGVLHHIKTPELAVKEMLRVSSKAIFISDSNNFGQGSFLMRSFKQAVNACGLWKAVDFVKTRGRGYTISEGDGLAYSYSVFTNYAQIRKECRSVHLLNTSAGGINPYRTSDHIALIGIKA